MKRTILLSMAFLIACKGADVAAPAALAPATPPVVPTKPAPSSITLTSPAIAAPAGTLTTAVAQVKDQDGLPLAGVTVTFTTSGGGSVAASSTTDASGNATAAWTLGRSAVPQSLIAATGALASSVDATITSEYTVDVRFVGPAMPAQASAAFTAAAARVRAMVVGDVPDVTIPAPGADMSVCGVGTLLSGTVDDLVVYASVAPIDGPGGVLANAGPCYVRTQGQQTIVGVMMFDSADVATMIGRGLLNDVVLHEMLHIVGVGTLWQPLKLLSGGGTADARYTGALGITGCLAGGGAMLCASTIPVHSSDGAGSADGHWRESVFGNELMTAFISSGANPLSAMTIRSLADEGYAVNALAADPFTIAPSSSSIVMRSLSPTDGTSWEGHVLPTMEISPTGHISTRPKI